MENARTSSFPPPKASECGVLHSGIGPIRAVDAFRKALRTEPVKHAQFDGQDKLALCEWRTNWIDGFDLPANDDVVIAIHRDGSRNVRAKNTGGLSAYNSIPGCITIIPPTGNHSFAVGGEVEFETVHIPRSLLGDLGLDPKENLPGFRFGVLDAFICACIEAIHAESLKPGPCGEKFVSSVTQSLVLHLLRTGAALHKTNEEKTPCFSRIFSLIDASLSCGISLDALAEEAGLSRAHFARKFRAETGLSPHKYLLTRRVEKAKERLSGRSDSLIEISYDLGFSSQSHFTKVFRDEVGMTPLSYRATAGVQQK